MHCRSPLVLLTLLSASTVEAGGAPPGTGQALASPLRAEVSGEARVWHRVTISVEGPEADEAGNPNPFLHRRLDVHLRQGNRKLLVPGHFAADGRSAETGSTRGRVWRAFFLPPSPGRWEFEAVLRSGPRVAVADDAPVVDSWSVQGAFQVLPTDKTGRDLRARGLLAYSGGRYLRFAGSGRPYLKGGAGSPENLLAYADFDGTYDAAALTRQGEARGEKFLHRYEPHLRDWRPGDPTWRDGRGKAIIGALNYLASKGMNSVYFLTMNVGGDGMDVWPWTAPHERLRFDVSRLDQWEIVFSHMDRLGIALHVITQETENDQLLDGGELGDERRLYYRELVSRFGHHPAIVWNLGEESTNTDAQRRAFSRHFHQLDPYDHPVVVHTYPGKYDEVYRPLLGWRWLEGPSLQTQDSHAQTLKWVELSARAGRPWVVCLDEIGPAHSGVKPDVDDPGHDDVRSRHLWGHLMAGGAGVEWYFGYRWAHNDLNCEDWRSRDRMWDQTRHAIEFFRRWLPFTEMRPSDELLSGVDGYCLALPGRVWALYLPRAAGTARLDLGSAAGSWRVRWYDPRRGGELRAGSIGTVRGPGRVDPGAPPDCPEGDWAVLVDAPRPMS